MPLDQVAIKKTLVEKIIHPLLIDYSAKPGITFPKKKDDKHITIAELPRAEDYQKLADALGVGGLTASVENGNRVMLGVTGDLADRLEAVAQFCSGESRKRVEKTFGQIARDLDVFRVNREFPVQFYATPPRITVGGNIQDDHALKMAEFLTRQGLRATCRAEAATFSRIKGFTGALTILLPPGVPMDQIAERLEAAAEKAAQLKPEPGARLSKPPAALGFLFSPEADAALDKAVRESAEAGEITVNTPEGVANLRKRIIEALGHTMQPAPDAGRGGTREDPSTGAER